MKTLFLFILRFFYFYIKRIFISHKHYDTVIVNLAGGIGDMILIESFLKQFDDTKNALVVYQHTAEYLKLFIKKTHFIIIDRENIYSEIGNVKVACNLLLVPKEDMEAHLTAAIIKAKHKKYLLKAYSNPLFNTTTKFIYRPESLARSFFGIKNEHFNIMRIHLVMYLYYKIFINFNYDEVFFSYKKHYLESFEEFFEEKSNFFLPKKYTDTKTVIICPFTSDVKRNLCIQNLVSISKEHQKYNFIFIGKGVLSQNEANILSKQKNILNLINQTTFEDLFELYNKSDYYIGADTGMAHLAMKYQLKTLVIINNASALNLFYNYYKENLTLFPIFATHKKEDVFDYNLYDITTLNYEYLNKQINKFLT